MSTPRGATEPGVEARVREATRLVLAVLHQLPLADLTDEEVSAVLSGRMAVPGPLSPDVARARDPGPARPGG